MRLFLPYWADIASPPTVVVRGIQSGSIDNKTMGHGAVLVKVDESRPFEMVEDVKVSGPNVATSLISKFAVHHHASSREEYGVAIGTHADTARLAGRLVIIGPDPFALVV